MNCLTNYTAKNIFTFPFRSESAESIMACKTPHGGEPPKDFITFSSSWFNKILLQLLATMNRKLPNNFHLYLYQDYCF